MGVEFEGGRLFKNIQQVDKRSRAFIYATCRLHARRAQSYARRNAPWTDQTSNARNGLVSAVFKNGDKTGIIVAGTVDYQIWLEIRWSGRYQIIRPTIAKTGPEVFSTLQSGWVKAVGGGK